MNFQEYSDYFQTILNTEPAKQNAPYNQVDYMDYSKLNWSRMNRWFKTGKLSESLVELIKQIELPMQWITITEPWCGDAAHNIPFIEKLARENALISVRYVLRDTEPFLINDYLTEGTKSIPKLIIRNAQGKDLATWGPRPAGCQELYAALKKEAATFDTIKIEIQNWYNENKGVAIQQELTQTLAAILENNVNPQTK